MTTTKPTDFDAAPKSSAPSLAIEATYQDPVTGALYVHDDLRQAIGPWESEAHISPASGNQRLGDVESWSGYVTTYGHPDTTLVSWSERGLSATLDFHGKDGEAGRCQFKADHPFVFSPQWSAWAALANGQPRQQKQVIESLEDLAEDIVAPDQAALLSILRTLRSTATASGSTTLNPDGSTAVEWRKEATVTGKAEIPGYIMIRIPVLKGHYRDDGEPQTYDVPIKLRPSIDDGAHVLFRLTIPVAERLLESVYADRVQAAKKTLGSGYSLLRAG